MARTAVGLDIGHHTVRAVALRRAGHSFAITGFAEARRRGDDGQPRPLSDVLAEIRRQVSLGSSPMVAYGDLVTLVKYVGTIPLPPDRLQRLLRLELLQAIEADELAADSFAVPFDADELIHCCVLAQPKHAHDALTALAEVGVKPAALHVAQAAVYNATVALPPVQDSELALLVDIGATSTNVALIGDRRLLACRQLPLGGDTFSSALAGGEGPVTSVIEQRLRAGDGLASPFAELAPTTARQPAADLGGLELDDDAPLVGEAKEAKSAGPVAASKVSFSADAPLEFADDHADTSPSPQTTSLHPHPVGSESQVGGSTRLPFEFQDNEPVTAPGRTTQQIATRTLGPELTKVAEGLYGQLASSLAWFRTQIHARQVMVKKVLLTGGGAGLDGLDTYLQRRFGLPVVRFDPCDGLTGRAPERPHEFATAIGLAVAAADTINGTCRLDLTPDRVLRQRQWRTRLIWPYVAAACLLIATVLAGWTMLNNQSVAQANLDSFASFKAHHDELKARLEALSKERDGLSEDLRAVAGRLYAGRDLLYTVRALKEQTLKSPELWITKLETVDIAGEGEVSDTRAATAVRGLGGAHATMPDAKKGARRDTAIDRGAVDVEGLVKFDDKKSDVEMNRFFEDYNLAIAKWTAGKDITPLYRDDKVLIHLVDRTSTTKPTPGGRISRRPAAPTNAEPGRFPFKLRFFFQATKLEDITAKGPLSKITKSVERQP